MAEDGSEGPRGRGRSASRFEDPEDGEEDPLGIQAFNSGDSDSGSASDGSDSSPAPRRRKQQPAPQRRARGGLSQQTLSIINDLNPHTVPSRSSDSEEEAAEEAKLAAEQEHVREERRREEDRARARRKRAARKQPKKEEEDHFDAFIKILLLGDQAVGKTSLMLRWAENRFEPSLLSTAGVDFKFRYLDIEGKRIKVQIWDTAGQERFHVITRAYYRGAHGIVLLYDVTDENTFANVGYWMNNIQQHATSDVEKIIVGNKIDMEDRMVDTHRGKAVAEQFGVPFVEASAKTGTNVDEALTVIARDVLIRMAQEAEEGAGGEAGAGAGAASSPDGRRKGKEKCSIV